MTEASSRKPLVVLVADKDMRFAVMGVLGRWQALGIRELAPAPDIHVHPHRDPGCLNRAHEFLRPFCRQYDHALVVFDHEGSGAERRTREQVEKDVEGRLSVSGWGDRAAAVVVEPELEAWVWSDSPHVETTLGWQGREPGLREWLLREHFLGEGEVKPSRPKEAMETAIRLAKKPRSAVLFSQLAASLSLRRCEDQAFKKLTRLLRQWFPRE